MVDPAYIPEDERELVVVYDSPQLASHARQRLLRMGVPDDEVTIGEETDEIASLRAEMHDELTNAWVVPNAAFVAPKEGIKGLWLVGGLASLFGVALAAPLAFIDFGSTFGVRLLVFVVLGLAAGATVGLVAGPSLGAKRPGELMAAHRGTVLRVQEDNPDIRAALTSLEPIRLDEVASDDTPLDTVVTEKSFEEEGAAEETVANLGGDDYHPTDPEKGPEPRTPEP
jgi:hypothetical protein